MTGQAHWLVLVPIVFCAILTGWFIYRDAREARRYRAEQRRFLCPTLHTKVEATLVRAADTNEVLGITSCSAFANPEAIACNRDCVQTFGPRVAQRRNATA